MKDQKLLFQVAIATIALAFAGCMTPVTVTTDPPGATVYCRGAGRPSYQWKYRGTTADGQPVVFKVPYNAVKTRAVWPAANGKPAQQSDVVYTKILFHEDPVINITKK